MPRQKDLKRLVRARMQKTGEAYTTARAQLTKTPKKKTAPAPAQKPQADYARLGGKSDAIMAEKTARTWEQWVELLDQHGAQQMPHGKIARLVNEKYGVDGWWSQTVTVGYERIKGLREIGQRRDGLYEANKSKTFNVPVEQVYDACADAKVRRRWLGVSTTLRTARKPVSIRLAWPDGTIVVLGFIDKGAKSSVAVQHTKLPDRATADRLKEFWAEKLSRLGEILSKR